MLVNSQVFQDLQASLVLQVLLEGLWFPTCVHMFHTVLEILNAMCTCHTLLPGSPFLPGGPAGPGSPGGPANPYIVIKKISCNITYISNYHQILPHTSLPGGPNLPGFPGTPGAPVAPGSPCKSIIAARTLLQAHLLQTGTHYQILRLLNLLDFQDLLSFLALLSLLVYQVCPAYIIELLSSTIIKHQASYSLALLILQALQWDPAYLDPPEYIIE